MNIIADEFSELNQIIDNTIEGILIIDEGFIINANKSLLKILCYDDLEEIKGNLATGILIPTLKEKFIQYNSETFQEISLISKNGDIISAIIKIKDIKIKNNTFKMVSILDLRELRQKEALLLEQSKLAAMGEMISMIAHQWRQPLSAIASIITRLNLKLKTKKLDVVLFEEKLYEMNTYLQYMSKTIDDFRDFLAIDKKKDNISINEIIKLSYTMIKETFDNKNIKLNIEEKQLKNINIYKNELVQVILNLLNNSKDAFVEKSIKNAKIDIYFKEDTSFQTIFIQDNAGGIPDKIIDKIFQPYFSTKKEKNGTGLGLYICKIIIEKYSNGTISVSNKNDGVLFTIRIQIA